MKPILTKLYYLLATVALIVGFSAFSAYAAEPNVPTLEKNVAPAVGNQQPTEQNSSNPQDAKQEQDKNLGYTQTFDEDALNIYKEYQGPMGSVKDITMMRDSRNNIRLILRVDEPFMARVEVKNFPYRLIIYIPMPYQWAVDSNKLKNKIPVNIIKSFSYGTFETNKFRISADLGRPVSIQRTYVVKVSEKEYDLILELGENSGNTVLVSNTVVYAKDGAIIGDLAKIARDREMEETNKKRGVKIDDTIRTYLANVGYPIPQNNYPDRKLTVVIDPGHGGKDPGAVTDDSSLVEKALVLGVSQNIKAMLEENKEINVVLTRHGDYYLPLKDRILWAQQNKADLFVSIHADKSEASVVSSGLSIYTLSDSASDAQAQILANHSNKSDLVAGVVLSKDDEEVNKILVSLSQRIKVNESVNLARSIVNRSVQKVKILPNPIRSAGFAVLKVPNIPSILVEIGFLSNEQDIENLKKMSYQETMANSISSGIQSYLWDRGLLSVLPLTLTTKPISLSVESPIANN